MPPWNKKRSSLVLTTNDDRLKSVLMVPQISIAPLRWHYPDQVQWVLSQPNGTPVAMNDCL